MQRFAKRQDLLLHGIGRRPCNLRGYSQIDLSRPFKLDFKPDIVIHGAALSSPWGSRKVFERQNVEATARVIEFCKSAGCPKLVYISSSSVFYRHCDQLGITEESPIGPSFVNEYARTKYLGEQLVAAYPGPSVILRPRAVFGPGDTVLFPRILMAAASGRLPLFVGRDAPVQGDLIYIDSLCDYMLRAALDENVQGSYNLTNNQPVAIQEFLLAVFDELGLPRPSRRVKLSTAMLAAAATELAYRVFQVKAEPPITRFGVSVFAYSKTFNVRRTLEAMGPPSVAIDEGVKRFVAWQRSRAS
jgi:nucleoside-diphosphate-sugar epimerase